MSCNPFALPDCVFRCIRGGFALLADTGTSSFAIVWVYFHCEFFHLNNVLFFHTLDFRFFTFDFSLLPFSYFSLFTCDQHFFHPAKLVRRLQRTRNCGTKRTPFFSFPFLLAVKNALFLLTLDTTSAKRYQNPLILHNRQQSRLGVGTSQFARYWLLKSLA